MQIDKNSYLNELSYIENIYSLWYGKLGSKGFEAIDRVVLRINYKVNQALIEPKL